MSEEPKDEMTHMEFNRAMFFSSDKDFAEVVAKSKAGSEFLQRQRRVRRLKDPEIEALRKFTAAVEVMNESSRRAAILWLADRYLGVKSRHW